MDDSCEAKLVVFEQRCLMFKGRKSLPKHILRENPRVDLSNDCGLNTVSCSDNLTTRPGK